MRATIWVPVKASPPSGDVGDTFRITVATERPGSAFVYDIQRLVPGGGWRDWRMGVASRAVEFRPTSDGTYQFRARLRRLSTQGVSLYSEPDTIIVG